MCTAKWVWRGVCVCLCVCGGSGEARKIGTSQVDGSED